MHTDFIQTIVRANKTSIRPVYQTNKPRPLFPVVRFSAPILQNISPACPSGKLLHTIQVFFTQKHTALTILFCPKKIYHRGGGLLSRSVVCRIGRPLPLHLRINGDLPTFTDSRIHEQIAYIGERIGEWIGKRNKQ